MQEAFRYIALGGITQVPTVFLFSLGYVVTGYVLGVVLAMFMGGLIGLKRI